MKGWQTRTFTEKPCEHHRQMGTATQHGIPRASTVVGGLHTRQPPRLGILSMPLPNEAPTGSHCGGFPGFLGNFVKGGTVAASNSADDAQLVSFITGLAESDTGPPTDARHGRRPSAVISDAHSFTTWCSSQPQPAARLAEDPLMRSLPLKGLRKCSYSTGTQRARSHVYVLGTQRHSLRGRWRDTA